MIKETVRKNGRGLLKGYSVREIKKFPFIYAILVLPIIQFAVFYFYVNVSSFVLAFMDENSHFSFMHFEKLYAVFFKGQEDLGESVWNMFFKGLIAWGIDNVLCYFINLFISFILVKHMIMSKTFRLIYFVPGIVGTVVLVAVKKEMLAYNGVITKMLVSFGVDLPVKAVRNGLLGAEETAYITLMIYRFVGGISGGSILFASAYMKIPEEIFESAKLEGCGLTREVFQIAVPCIWPTVTTLFILSLCSMLTFDYGAYLYSNGTGANGLTSIGYYMYRYQLSIRDDPTSMYLYGYLSAFGMVVTLVTMVVVFFTRWLSGKIQEDVSF